MEALQATQKEIEGALAEVEERLFALEERYLRRTPYGNAVRGWEGFLEARDVGTGTSSGGSAEDKDRLFSYSSEEVVDRKGVAIPAAGSVAGAGAGGDADLARLDAFGLELGIGGGPGAGDTDEAALTAPQQTGNKRKKRR